ncbi:MAG: efflux RND transporter periplasmic adaptor subunit [Burkholderiaceae bacterium]
MKTRVLALTITAVVILGLVGHRLDWWTGLFSGGSGGPAAGGGAPPAAANSAGPAKSGPGGGAGPGGPSSGGAPAAGAGPGGAGKGGGGPPTVVEVLPVVQRDISEILSVTGEFQAVNSVELRPEIPGRILRINYKDGQSVAAGDLLIGLDDRIARAELAQAQAEADLAASNFKRAQDLFGRQFISSRGLDEAKANAEIAAAKRDLAQARLARTELRAPFAGRVGLRQHSVGDYVKDGELLAVLEDNRRMHFDFRVPERFAELVRVGQRLMVQTDQADRAMHAQVAAVDVRVDQDGRFLQLRALVENPGQQFKTGMFGRARLNLYDRPGALLVSEEALVGDREGFFVWRVKDGRVEQARIQTGIRLQREVEVRSGLALGDSVVVAGQLKIRAPGQPVRAMPATGL